MTFIGLLAIVFILVFSGCLIALPFIRKGSAMFVPVIVALGIVLLKPCMSVVPEVTRKPLEVFLIFLVLAASFGSVVGSLKWYFEAKKAKESNGSYTEDGHGQNGSGISEQLGSDS